MGLLQDIDADKIITPETNFWEMISIDISLVCAAMTVTCGYWVDVAVGTEVWCFCCRNGQWAESNQFSQDRVLTLWKSLLFWWLCVALPPSFPLSLAVSAHTLHPSPWQLCSLWIPGCPFPWISVERSRHMLSTTNNSMGCSGTGQDNLWSNTCHFLWIHCNSSRLLPVL